MAERIIILGAGESGVGAAILAKQKGIDVFVSDHGEIQDKFRTDLTNAEIKFEEGQHTMDLILAADRVIKSPGIPNHVEVIKKITEKGITIISEIEFAYQQTDAQIVAITGSNGKSTTTKLTYDIFKNAGQDVVMAGNIGNSFAREVAISNPSIFILEISSFQLDDIDTFCPEISIILNIIPDHLDRYNYQISEYTESKFRITKNQTEDHHLIYCADDAVIQHYLNANNIRAQLHSFSLSDSESHEGYLKDNHLHITTNQKKLSMSIYELALQGQHNRYNGLAAGIASRIFEIKNEFIRDSMKNFVGLEHRMEHVSNVRGVSFVNDSKATNVNSVWYALDSADAPVVWIAGGVDKGNEYEPLIPLVQKKVKAIVCLGTDNRKLHGAFSTHVDVMINTQSMEEAVKVAYHLSDKDETVLLSPACASFDLFENYEDRGRQFKRVVRML